MSRRNVEDLYPLTPLQQGLLFHTLYEPEAGLYVEQLSCVLGGPLDAQAFERAWQQVVERHAVLRTAFVTKDLAEPLQAVLRSVKLPCAKEDWRGLGRAEQRERLGAYLDEDRRRGFDLSKAPLMRLALVRLSDDEHQFVWTYHHLLLDGWCVPLVLKEVFAFYEAAARGRAVSLERSRPYRDYIAWLRRQDAPRAAAFWRETLRGFDAPTPLPSGRATGDASAALEGYGEQKAVVSTDITSALQIVARRHGLTLNTLVQGAWALVLSRYSGEPDVVFGVTVSGRPAELAGVETMVGLFINTLPLRVRIEPRESFVVWSKRLQAQHVELRQYEHSPLVEVQGWSDVPRGLPLFESLLVFENYPVDASLQRAPEGLSISGVSKIEKTNYPLTILAGPGAELSLHASYDRQRFDDDAVSRTLGHLKTLLAAFASDPDARLDDLDILTGDERRRLLSEWNDTARAYPESGATLHELFERQAAATPDSVAVVCEDERLTYAELNARADALAQHLRSLGVGPESRVGVLLERSAAMVVALLGALKAGGAYVPLEPSYPRERLAFMAEDARVKVLLTQGHLGATVDGLGVRGCEVLHLDDAGRSAEGAGACAADTAEKARAAVGGDNLAYVIYTSGSTGRPKGAMNTHAGVVNRLLWMQEVYRLSVDDRVMQKTPFGFDVSVWEFFWPLITGARLVLARPEGHRDAAYLMRLIEREGITTLHFVPSMLQAFLSEPGLEDCRSLRRVMCSGEALTRELQERFHERTRAALHNLYGPTEAAIDVTFWPCERGGERTNVPIGRPVANTRIYITDAQLRPVPVGVAGELHIGGVQLARGYLRRPGLTAASFIPDPFSSVPGARLYKTGDLARYLEGGEIEFLGRLDHQVKLRGFRIELGEIEAALSEHPSVRECVVVAREDVPGDPRLVAYVVAAASTPDGGSTSGKVLREFLKEKLPEYMLPSAFVALEALPLTPNGKLDRRALPAPELERDAGVEASFASAHNPLEEVVAGVWAEVLGLAEVGREENFFELSGHSLRALRVVSRLRSALGAEVPVRELFKAPTVAGFTARIEELRRGGLGLVTAPLVADRTNGERPLSFAQQRLWFLDQLEPDGAAYNVAAAVRVEGALDTSALERAFGEIVRRHEALRASFVAERGAPRQTIAPALGVPLHVVDLREKTPGAEREAEVERIAREESARPFDLADAPLLRTTLLELSETEHVLLLTMHHIISDGWSLGVLVRETTVLYEAFAAGEASPLAELPIQYADFARWQRQTLRGEALERELAHWKKRLGGMTPKLALPTKTGRGHQPATRSRRSAARRFDLPAPLAEAIKSLSRREGATVYMTLLAAFQTLLHRYTGEHDVAVGSPVANRDRVETEPLIGFLVNTLVMRTDLAGDPAFTDLLKRVREICLDAYAHRDVPFEKLVEALQPERSLDHAPLFRVMFVWQNAPPPVLELPGLKLSPVITQGGVAKFDLTLSAEETKQGFACQLVYDADLFDEAAMARMAAHFEELLAGITSDPSRRLSELPLLTEGERRRLLFEWNDTADVNTAGGAATLHELFERQAERTPDGTAVVYEGERVSYRELNRRADVLARRLRAAGIGAESPVGVCAERSVELIVAVLGILKAGGAYVPLDPEYPRERLSFMIDDARIKALLTQRRLDELLDGLGGRDFERLYLDDAHQRDDDDARADAGAVAEGATANVSARNKANVFAENAAYVIYTSGSTGRPKGVVVSHRAVVNSVGAHLLAQREPITSALLQIPYAFDSSLIPIFGTLCQGGTLVVPREGQHADPSHIMRLAGEEQVAVFLSTPSIYALMLDEARPGQLKLLRAVYVGGEICAPRLVERHHALAPHAALFNEYGPTEATIWCAMHACRAPTAAAPVPIGRPGANMRVYVLDEQLRPAPVGVAGELYVGGAGVARGYLNRPELTAAAFIPDPFSGDAGARLYRTGDVVRWLEEGELEYVGRRDSQVKVRGFRVELGEVEAALAAHAAVREAVVVAQGDAPSVQSLTAYYTVADGEPTPTALELRSHLRARLPEYMVPSAFVVLDALPLTPNGKLDRRALPEPERAGASVDWVAPRTNTEKVLSDIWCEVLGVERVGAFDGFFELGGHSLLATQAVARAREAFRVELPLRELFEAPTVAGLAERVEAALKQERATRVPPLLPVGREGALPLSFAQQRLWFLDQLEPGNPFYNIPSAVILKGALDAAALARSINEVVRRHEVLRTTFEAVQGEPRQTVAPELSLPLPLVDLRGLADAERSGEVRRLAAEEAQRPFDLARGPLARARLLRTGAREHVLLFTIHHIVSDGWSSNVLFREVAQLYQAFVEGRPSSLEELPIQYADFAVWQREWLRGEALEEQLDYWRGQLGGLPPLLELPTDRPRPRLQSYHGATERFVLAPEVAEALRRLGRDEGVTLFMLLLAAFDVLLARYTGQTDIAVGTPIANRTRGETESLIGFFANTLALRTDLSGDPTFRALVGRVREVCLGAYAHQDVPFERVVEELQPERDMSHAPLFQVMFALQEGAGAQQQTPPPRGLEMRPLLVESGIAKFDLTLAVSETAEGMACALEYNTGLFDAATAKRMAGHWQQLLRGIARDAGARVSELPLLTEEERRQLIVGWNDWGGARTDGACVHELFERRAGETPDAVAAVCGGEELTYAELDRRANRLARHLRRRGVGAEKLVGVLLERSAEMLVAVLGVLKAGGAYLPLDPSYPRERLSYIMEDARASLLITRERLAGIVAVDGAARRAARRGRGRDRARERGEPARLGDGGKPRLRDLHVRLDGQAERGRSPTRLAREPQRGRRRALQPLSRRPRVAVRVRELRRGGGGVVRVVVVRRGGRPHARGRLLAGDLQRRRREARGQRRQSAFVVLARVGRGAFAREGRVAAESSPRGRGEREGVGGAFRRVARGGARARRLDERIRADRSDHHRDPLRADGRRATLRARLRAHRATGAERDGLSARPFIESGANRRGGRAVSGRRLSRARLSRPARTDGGEVHPRPVLRGRGRATLPHGRRGPLPRGREPRLRRAHRRAGQDSRLPRRTRTRSRRRSPRTRRCASAPSSCARTRRAMRGSSLTW